MTRGILIAGNESGLSRAIAAEAAQRVERYALATITSRFLGAPSAPAQDAPENAPLQWNPGSPISARTLVLAAENRLDHINEALLICAPPSIRRAAAELTLADIEVMVNDHIKGWFFLVKELTVAFKARGAGTLALVYTEAGTGGGRDDMADILGPAATASFQAFTRSLLASAHTEPYVTMGFSCTEAGSDTGFASYIFKILDEGNKRDNGKLHKYGRLSIFK
jgi:NAD(P)-dependent dehydrogenase (short-subunit alcohol dehydrogenase family)